MDTTTQDTLSTQQLQHLGLVMDTIEQLGIIQHIDEEIPVDTQKGAIVSMGHRVAAMILNGLGFVSSPLYLYDRFLEKKAISRLFGEAVQAKHFNDDALGRCLDALYDYGVEKLFAALAYRIALGHNLLGKSTHLDTTSLSLYGQYPGAEDAPAGTPIPKQGYSKDHHPDLKQMILTLATSGPASLPLWMESQSGNASDQVILQEAAQRMEAFGGQLQEAPNHLYVADSAIYSSCVAKGKNVRWLSRVPASIGMAKSPLRKAADELRWQPLPKGYRYTMRQIRYKGIDQRWCLIFSQQAYEREVATIDPSILQEEAQAKKHLWHLSCRAFGCQKDDRQEVKTLEKTLKYHRIEAHLTPIEKHAGRGRPAAGAKPSIQGYRVHGQLVADTAAIAKRKSSKGRFILATNELDTDALPDEALLAAYKEQQHTERGFRFIKEDSLHLSSIFLKKPTRISALMMVMVLCLFVYNFSQYQLRRSLAQRKETIPNQVNKPTAEPTMRYVFQLFDNVQLLHGAYGQRERVLNVSMMLRQIIGHFGPRAHQIYGLAPQGELCNNSYHGPIALTGCQ
ncbi:MAG: IS1634 family transposase [Bacteroidota bacterium]